MLKTNFLFSNKNSKDATALVTIKTASVTVHKDLIHHINKSNWKLIFIYFPYGSNMNLLSHSLEQKSHKIVFVCHENICKSVEDKNKPSEHPKI